MGIFKTKRKTDKERFWEKVDKSGECWEWTAGKNSSGYGKFNVNGKTTSSHRFSYEIANGYIPDGMLVCHRCDNPACIRPSHLFVGTDGDNARDRNAKGRAAKGEEQGGSKLTEKDVKKIRDEYSHGKTTQENLAKKYGVWQRTISDVVNRITWEHVK